MTDRVIELGILAVAFITSLGGFVWRLNTVRDKILDRIDSKHKELDDDLKGIRQELAGLRVWVDSELGVIRREFGETVAALREKVHQVERDGLQWFVRRESFSDAIGRVERTMENGLKEVKEAFVRLEKRLNKESS